jgi:hypothetical protein
MHFDKDCGGPKNQTHGAGPAGQGKWMWYFGCARRLGYGPSTERVARVARHGPERSRLPRPSQHQDHPARLFLSACASSWHGGGGLKLTAQETLQTSLRPAGPGAATSLSSGRWSDPEPLFPRSMHRGASIGRTCHIESRRRLVAAALSVQYQSLELTSCSRTPPSPSTRSVKATGGRVSRKTQCGRTLPMALLRFL